MVLFVQVDIVGVGVVGLVVVIIIIIINIVIVVLIIVVVSIIIHVVGVRRSNLHSVDHVVASLVRNYDFRQRVGMVRFVAS